MTTYKNTVEGWWSSMYYTAEDVAKAFEIELPELTEVARRDPYMIVEIECVLFQEDEDSWEEWTWYRVPASKAYYDFALDGIVIVGDGKD